MLGVKGTVIITHGRAKRRMIGYACDVAATTARTRVPDARSPKPLAEGRRRDATTDVEGHELTVGAGSSPNWSASPRSRSRASSASAGAGRPGAGCSAGQPSRSAFDGDRVRVRLWVVARPGQALRPLTAQVGTAVAATVERLLGLELGGVTVVVDGVGN